MVIVEWVSLFRGIELLTLREAILLILGSTIHAVVTSKLQLLHSVGFMGSQLHYAECMGGDASTLKSGFLWHVFPKQGFHKNFTL